MNHFELRDEVLWCEHVPLARIAAAVGTPVYVYSTATLERHFRVFRDALQAYPTLGAPLIAYAVKANSNISVLTTLGRLGAGADTVSEGEIRRAMAAGIPAERIVFSGVGKTAREIAFAIDAGVAQINVESEPELRLIADIAGGRGGKAPIALRINPDVEGGAHAKISTGRSQSKFGVSITDARPLYAWASAHEHLRPVGLACHIGSQIVSLAPLEEAFGKMRGLIAALRGDGLPVQRLDLGGGLGVPYFNQPDPPDPASFAAMAARAIGSLAVDLIFEPGRVIAANAGVLLASVIHIAARSAGPRFVVIDAAMNDLIRPAMYEAFHDIRPVAPRRGQAVDCNVVGPVCESADTFAHGRRLPPLEAGDLVAFMTAGAYGAVMAGEYNSRLLVPEVLVNGEAFAVIRARPTYEDMLSRETSAPWL